MKVVEIDRFAIGIDSGWRISARQGIQNSIFWYEWLGGECVNRPRPHVYAWGRGRMRGGYQAPGVGYLLSFLAAFHALLSMKAETMALSLRASAT